MLAICQSTWPKLEIQVTCIELKQLNGQVWRRSPIDWCCRANKNRIMSEWIGWWLRRDRFLGAEKHLYKRFCPPVRRSVGPLRLLIFGGFWVLRSTAWPVLALVQEWTMSIQRRELTQILRQRNDFITHQRFNEINRWEGIKGDLWLSIRKSEFKSFISRCSTCKSHFTSSKKFHPFPFPPPAPSSLTFSFFGGPPTTKNKDFLFLSPKLKRTMTKH